HLSFGIKCSLPRLWLAGCLAAWCVTEVSAGIDPVWQNLSSKHGDLPTPRGGSTQQTGALIGDFDGDGVNDFILSFRQKAPALIWYRRTASGWDDYVIDKDYLTIEAGGAVCDIDGDGDLDIVFGGDWQSDTVWWWENPAPNFDKNVPWKRHVVKTGGKTQHHDQVFGDFLGTGKPQLAFWNQQAKTLYLAEIPDDPRHASSWPLTEIVSGTSSGSTPYTEGISAFDVDGDGKVDLLAYNTWFKHTGGKTFKPIKLAEEGGLIFAGYFKPSKVAQIVISPGDGNGPLRWYECNGDPEEAKAWVGHDLLEHPIIHGHTLQLGDVNRDGNLDIFVAEMAKWSENQPNRDHPQATAWVFYGNGQGQFTRSEVIIGHGWHEGQLADLDGDGDLDLLNKPYNWDTPRVDVWLNNGTRAGARGVGTSASFHGPVGLQLYSLRDILAANVGLGLQYAHNFGFREVELAGTYGLAPDQFRAALAHFQLKPISAIYDYDRFVNEPEKVIAEAKSLGVRYVGTAGIPHEATLTEAEVRKAAAVFNQAGEAMAKAGLKFFYHNHGFEFVPREDGTLFDLLMAETKPEWVSFEMDIFWTVHPGQDPVKLLEKYPNRWALMHVKDMRQGTKTGLLTGSEDVHNDVELGSGQIDIPAVLRKAQQVGVKHFFIEDESPISTQQLPQSLRYLESLAW
ncbi:MAG TPA: sugar phosphate isomerase/epimerase, partial [Verrucomicrobiae bacterium]|nr:sugar phosphate isomerase/epimerase [Verrucomicrobiae bacterium]